MNRIIAFALIVTTTVLSACQQDQSNIIWTTPALEAPVASTTGTSSFGSVQSLRDMAVGVLEQAGSSDHPQMRANAIEALHGAREFLEPYVRAGLIDSNRGVRFVAAMTVGKFDELNQIAHLVEPLLHDDSESVRAAAIFALRRSGERVDLNPLAHMLQRSDPEVRGNVALILGELGNPSAIPMLEQVVGKGLHLANPSQVRIVDLQLAEAMVKLGSEDRVDAIRAALFLPPEFQEITALAATMVGRLGDRGAAGGLWRLITAEDRRTAEVRIAAVTALARLGEDVPLQLVREYVRHERWEIRHQAAGALGEIGSREVLTDLHLLLQDENPLVRVAAAGAIVKLFWYD